MMKSIPVTPMLINLLKEAASDIYSVASRLERDERFNYQDAVGACVRAAVFDKLMYVAAIDIILKGCEK